MLVKPPSVAGYRVTELVLCNNALESIETGSLAGLTRLTVLDLSHNRLTTLDSSALPWTNLTDVLIGGNPWNCSVDESSTQCSVNAWMVTQSAVVRSSVT